MAWMTEHPIAVLAFLICLWPSGMLALGLYLGRRFDLRSPFVSRRHGNDDV